MPFFILLLLWGLLELFVIIIVADVIGALATIALLIAGIVVGSWLIRGQQARWLNNMQASNQAKVFEASSLQMKDGMFRLVAGVFLILPGFLTDLLALIFVLPPLRRLFGQQMMRLFKVDMLASKFVYRRQGEVYEHDESSVQTSDDKGSVIHGTLEDGNFRDK